MSKSLGGWSMIHWLGTSTCLFDVVHFTPVSPSLSLSLPRRDLLLLDLRSCIFKKIVRRRVDRDREVVVESGGAPIDVPWKKSCFEEKPHSRIIGSILRASQIHPRSQVHRCDDRRWSFVRDREEKEGVSFRVPTFEPQAANYEFRIRGRSGNCVLRKEHPQICELMFVSSKYWDAECWPTGVCSSRCASDESSIRKWHFYVQYSRKVSAHAAPLISYR